MSESVDFHFNLLRSGREVMTFSVSGPASIAVRVPYSVLLAVRIVFPFHLT